MTELTADCARCAALCCRLSSFDRSAEFSFSKAAGEACRHLTKQNACAVHARRLELGLSGCVGFECFGAGQALTARLTPSTDLRVAVAAFHALAEVHFCLRLVALARRLGYSAQVVELEDRLTAYSRLSVDELAELDTSGLRFTITPPSGPRAPALPPATTPRR